MFGSNVGWLVSGSDVKSIACSKLQSRFGSPGIAQDHVTSMLVMNQLAFTLKILFRCATARSPPPGRLLRSPDFSKAHRASPS